MGTFSQLILKPQTAPNGLLEEIHETVKQLQDTHLWFDNESDPDLIDACVYQLVSLEARYRYLMRLARDRQLSAEMQVSAAE